MTKPRPPPARTPRSGCDAHPLMKAQHGRNRTRTRTTHMPRTSNPAKMHAPEARTLRFWDWVNGGWVKIAVRPGQELAWYAGGPADEGYHCEVERYEHDGDGVKYTRNSWGRDCDGRYEHSNEAFAHADKLASVPTNPDSPAGTPTGIPNWVTKREHQRDYTAEAAGY